MPAFYNIYILSYNFNRLKHLFYRPEPFNLITHNKITKREPINGRKDAFSKKVFN